MKTKICIYWIVLPPYKSTRRNIVRNLGQKLRDKVGGRNNQNQNKGRRNNQHQRSNIWFLCRDYWKIKTHSLLQCWPLLHLSFQLCAEKSTYSVNEKYSLPFGGFLGFPHQAPTLAINTVHYYNIKEKVIIPQISEIHEFFIPRKSLSYL